jgi:hypothetical protein
MVGGGAAVLLVTLASGCSMFAEAPPARTAAPRAKIAKSEKLPPLEGTGAKAEAESLRHVGDVAVRRYSGSFRDAPITVTEEVVAQEGKLIVVDITIEQGDEKQMLRVRYDARSDRAVRVSHLEGQKELPGTLSELEDLMAEVSFAPDFNDGKVSSKNETCLVGPRELECELTKYKVYVGDQKATLAVSRSSELGQDVAGEVVAVDGTVIYRAELLDSKSGAGESTASAKLDK